MAITAIASEDKLKLALSYAQDGKAKTASKTYRNVSTSAEAADVYGVGVLLGGLQSRAVAGIYRISETELVEGAA